MGSRVVWAARLAAASCVVGLCGCATTGRPSGASRPLVLPGLVPLRTIVVDAGHGGRDSGTSHYGLREKDLTLDIARRLKRQLEGAGFAVVMTRARDEFVALSRRAALANRIPADLFLSVHVNANRRRSVAGVEVYYPRESRVDVSAALPPRVESEEVLRPTTTIRQILWDLALDQSRSHSARVATHVCRSLGMRLLAQCRGVRPARFVVLREAWMPAALVEVGYVSNRPEAAKLRSAAYREAIAEGIARGVFAYLQDLNGTPAYARSP